MAIFTYSFGNVEEIATGKTEPFLSFDEMIERSRRTESVLPYARYYGAYQEGEDRNKFLEYNIHSDSIERFLIDWTERIAKRTAEERGKKMPNPYLICIGYGVDTNEKKTRIAFSEYNLEGMRILPLLNLGKINFGEKKIPLLDLNGDLRNSQEVIRCLAVYKQARENYGLTRFEEAGMIALEGINKFQKICREMKTRREQLSRRSSKNFPI